MSDGPFFIGWSNRLPAAWIPFHVAVAIVLLTGFTALGYLMGRHLDDPGRNVLARAGAPQARPDGWQGDQTFAGTLTLRPYPVLHVSTAPGGPVTRSMLLSGSGKRGATVPATSHRVQAVGGLVHRGDIDMLVVDDDSVTETAVEGHAPVAQPLGRWRALGEICDGKCYPGGMTPGGGLAHRACASLCLDGEVPAVFVTASPVAGFSFLVLAGPDGGLPPEAMRAFIGRPVVLEGEVQRLGALALLRVDPARMEIP
jgi:hypothetical protein